MKKYVILILSVLLMYGCLGGLQQVKYTQEFNKKKSEVTIKMRTNVGTLLDTIKKLSSFSNPQLQGSDGTLKGDELVYLVKSEEFFKKEYPKIMCGIYNSKKKDICTTEGDWIVLHLTVPEGEYYTYSSEFDIVEFTNIDTYEIKKVPSQEKFFPITEKDKKTISDEYEKYLIKQFPNGYCKNGGFYCTVVKRTPNQITMNIYPKKSYSKETLEGIGCVKKEDAEDLFATGLEEKAKGNKYKEIGKSMNSFDKMIVKVDCSESEVPVAVVRTETYSIFSAGEDTKEEITYTFKISKSPIGDKKTMELTTPEGVKIKGKTIYLDFENGEYNGKPVLDSVQNTQNKNPFDIFGSMEGLMGGDIVNITYTAKVPEKIYLAGVGAKDLTKKAEGNSITLESDELKKALKQESPLVIQTRKTILFGVWNWAILIGVGAIITILIIIVIVLNLIKKTE